MDARLDPYVDVFILAPYGTAAERAHRKALCSAF